MKLSAINDVLWVIGFVFQVFTAILIHRRNQVRTFPVFFTYTIFHVIQGVLTFIALNISYPIYFYAWWIFEVLDAFATLAVIQEIFSVTFLPYNALRRWGTRLYVTATVLLCLAAIFMGVHHPEGYSPRVSALLTLDRSASFVQFGLTLFLFIFWRLFGLTWRHFVFGISSGLVILAALMTTTEALRTCFGSSVNGEATIANAPLRAAFHSTACRERNA